MAKGIAETLMARIEKDKRKRAVARIAGDMGVSGPALTMILSGRRSMGMDVAEKAAAFYNLELKEKGTK